MIRLTRTTLVAVALMALATGTAYAQPEPDARRCKDTTNHEVVCTSTVGGVETPLDPTIVRFGEGVVHAPGSELAFLVVANYDQIPITVTIQLLVSGLGLVTRTLDVPPDTRTGYALHDDPALTGLRTFSTRVYAPGDVDVSLVLRPQVNPWSHATLPPFDVTRP